jgi:hypothetical protein
MKREGPPKALDEDDVAFLAEYDLTRQRHLALREQEERDELARFEAQRATIVYSAEEPEPIPLLSALLSPSSATTATSTTLATSPVPPKKKGIMGVSIIKVAPKRKQPDGAVPPLQKTTTATIAVIKASPTPEKKQKTDTNEEKKKNEGSDDDDEGGGFKLVDY